MKVRIESDGTGPGTTITGPDGEILRDVVALDLSVRHNSLVECDIKVQATPCIIECDAQVVTVPKEPGWYHQEHLDEQGEVVTRSFVWLYEDGRYVDYLSFSDGDLTHGELRDPIGPGRVRYRGPVRLGEQS